MNRRNFITMVGSAGVAAGLNSIVKAETSSAAAGNSISVSDEEMASLPGDVDKNIFKPLYTEILNIPAINNHMHCNDEESTINWYLPKLPGKTNVMTSGVLDDLKKLLNISGKITNSNKNAILKKYEKYCKDNSQTKYWDDLSRITNTSNIIFMTQPELPENKTLLSKRYKMCMHVDQYIFPLDNSNLAPRNPESKYRASANTDMLNREIKAMGINSLPKKFDKYLEFVEAAFLKQQSIPNIVGGKWSLAYFRTFDFRPGKKSDAKKVYESADTTPAAYKELQDYMAYFMLKLFVKHKFPLQIHSGLGAGKSLVLSDSQPAKLDYLLSMDAVKDAKVCFLHGGYPFCNQLGPMVKSRPGIFIDFSWMTLLLSPDTLARYLKEWMEVCPPWNLLFGIDATGLAQFRGNWCGRKALAIALARMLKEQQLTEAEAHGFAKGIMRNNALKFYETTWG